VQTYRASGEHWLDVFHENGPPLLQQLRAVRGNVARCLHVPRFRVENCLPRLNGTDKVHDLGVLSKPSRSQHQQRSLTFYIPFERQNMSFRRFSFPPMHQLILNNYYTGLFSRTTWVSWYQKGKSSLNFKWGKRWRDFGMAVASAGPYANNLQLAPDR